ncbi:glycosyltransferase [Neobacillus sp. YIM B06451]|uniref:glycosyltransferase family 2 protein n=1 Tax=Neobacillus sp. YIM B06451 TaxID=3070994 RepID=UPI00292D85ED|nr:glycosyltransferase [Neobacillus sp. YIM B06451]
MSNPKISIIITIYQVEQYLVRCIDSVLNQTFKDFELILVDNGSTDGSSHICNKYKQKDSRIKFIQKNHGSIASGRNFGLKHAKGEFIQFMDADDSIDAGMLEKMHQSIVQYNADLITCGYKKMYKNKNAEEYFVSCEVEDRVFKKQDFLSVCAKYCENFILYFVWNKLYRADIIKSNGIWFDESITRSEDVLFNFDYIKKANRFVFIKDPLYIYNRSNVNSTSKGFHIQDVEMQSLTYNRIRNYLIKQGVYQSNERNLEHQYAVAMFSLIAQAYLTSLKVPKKVRRGYIESILQKSCTKKALQHFSNSGFLSNIIKYKLNKSIMFTDFIFSIYFFLKKGKLAD